MINNNVHKLVNKEIKKVNKNGTFETCSNRTCNYRKQIAEPVSEAEESNS